MAWTKSNETRQEFRPAIRRKPTWLPLPVSRKATRLPLPVSQVENSGDTDLHVEFTQSPIGNELSCLQFFA